MRGAWLAIVAAVGCGTSAGAPPDAGAVDVDARASAPDATRRAPDAHLPADASLPDASAPDDAAAVAPVELRCAHAIGGPLDDDALAIAVDLDGSTVVAGRFQGTASFGDGTSLAARGVTDGFIARYDRGCALDWAVGVGGPGATVAISQIVVARGGLFVEGTLAGGAAFGADELDAPDASDLFVARTDASGAFGGAIVVGPDAPGGLALAADGGVFVGGADGASGGFLSRRRPDLSEVWALPLGVAPAALASDGAGVALAGAFAGQVTLGVGRSATTLVSAFRADCGSLCEDPEDRSVDAVTAVFAGDGSLAWARAARGGGDDFASGVAVDLDGNVVSAGRFGGVVTGGPGSLRFDTTAIGTAGSDADVDAFVAEYDSYGALRWARDLGGDGIDYATAAAVALDGTVLVTGAVGGDATFGALATTGLGGEDAFACALTPKGDVAWAHTGGGAADDVARAVCVYADGTASVAGGFSGDAAFPPLALAPAGAVDAFWLAVGPKPSPLALPRLSCLRGEGGTGIDHALAVAGDADDSFVVFGAVSAGATLGAGEPGATTFVSSGEFLARYRADCTLAWAKELKARGAASLEASLTVGPEGITLARPFGGVADVEGTTFTATSGGDDGLVARFDADGGLVWARHLVAGAPIDHLAHAISGDAVYVGVSYGGASSLVSLNVGGALRWSDDFAGDGADGVDWARVAAAPDGAYFTGVAWGAVDFGGQRTACPHDDCVAIAHFADDGTLETLATSTGWGAVIPRAIAARAGGGLLLTGTIAPANAVDACVTFGAAQVCAQSYADAFLAAYDDGDQPLFAVTAAGGLAWEAGEAVAATPDGGAIVGGVYGGPFGDPGLVGQTVLPSLGSYDLFVARYDASGAAVWARAGGGPTQYDSAFGVAVTPDGAAIAVGRFAGDAVFDYGLADVTELGSDGQFDDFFIARYGP